jgi:hypothetical protein
MFRRHHFLAIASVASVIGVLSATSAGCSDPAQATPRVTFDSQVTAGTHPQAGCGKTGPWFTIGSFGNPQLGHMNPDDPASPLIDPVRPVDDGAADQQGSVSISCSVTAGGDGFDVKATVQLTGATGGSVSLFGHVTPAGDSPNITVNLTKGGETFKSAVCVMKFDATVGQAVAAGRIWGTADCADANNDVSQQLCTSHVQIRLENCGQ